MIFVNSVFPNQYFATGNYTVQMNDPNNEDAQKMLPLMLKSSGNQHNWQAIDLSLILPKTDAAANSWISSIHCENKICVAVGNVEVKKDTKTLFKSFVLNSVDAGVTWSLSADKNYYSAEKKLNSVYSSHGVFYIAGEMNNKPLILTSIDNGNTWNDSLIVNFPLDIHSGHINHLNCVGAICIATGKVSTQDKNDAVLILRKQDNMHWKYIDAISDLPPKFRLFEITNSSCSNDLCITGGSYTNSDGKLIPMLLTSEDKGNSWKFNSVMSLPVLSDFYSRLTDAYIGSVSCSPYNCFATGTINYRKSTEHYRRFSFFLSKEKTNQWEVHTDDMPLSLVSCNEHNCIINGYKFGNIDSSGLAFLVGTLRGENWHRVQLGSIGSIASINSIHCLQHTCLATGVYREDLYYKKPDKPLILTSEDNGYHWNWEQKIDFLPANMFQGRLYSNTVSTK